DPPVRCPADRGRPAEESPTCRSSTRSARGQPGEGYFAIFVRNGMRFLTKSFLGDAPAGSLCEYVVCRSISTRFFDGIFDCLARAFVASSTRVPPSAAPNAYIFSVFGRSLPCVACTSRIFCPAFLLPAATTAASIVSFIGWYQA